MPNTSSLLGATVGGTCQQHMKEVQEELMEDYSINPDVVKNCAKEIKVYCGRVEKGGKTLDCLMEKAMEKKGKDNQIEFSDTCYDAVRGDILYCFIIHIFNSP